MARLNYIKGGDLLSPRFQADSVNIILHCCNSEGIMGAGVAKALYKKWPQVKKQYLLWNEMTQKGYHLEEELGIENYSRKYQYHFPNPSIRRFGLGNVQLIGVEGDSEHENFLVANMIGQKGIRPNNVGVPPVRYVAFQTAFSFLKDMHAESEVGITIHVPYLMGCDLAGGEWEMIEEYLKRYFVNNDIEVKIYDLFGKYPHYPVLDDE